MSTRARDLELNMDERPSGLDRHTWAGPLLFTVVLIGIVALFIWFLF